MQYSCWTPFYYKQANSLSGLLPAEKKDDFPEIRDPTSQVYYISTPEEEGGPETKKTLDIW
jgi:hypothetical protein